MASPRPSQTDTVTSEAALGQQVKDVQGENSKDVKEEPNPPSDSMDTEEHVEKEENVQDMLVESPAPAQDSVEIDHPQGELEPTIQLERDGSSETQVEHVGAVCVMVEETELGRVTVEETEEVRVTAGETEVARVTAGETETMRVTTEVNEQMETNQDTCDIKINPGDIESVVDELAATVNDSTNISERENNAECREPASESMETDQLTVKEDCVTDEVTAVTPEKSDDEVVTQDEVNNKVTGSDLNNATVNRTSPGPSEVAIPQVSVAMEIDTDGENLDTCSVTKPDVTESNRPHVVQESEIVPNVALSQPVESMQGETSAIINSGNTTESDANETLLQAENNSDGDGLGTKLAADT